MLLLCYVLAKTILFVGLRKHQVLGKNTLLTKHWIIKNIQCLQHLQTLGRLLLWRRHLASTSWHESSYLCNVNLIQVKTLIFLGVIILPASFRLPSSSSSSRCYRGCWDSSSSPPSAQPGCHMISLEATFILPLTQTQRNPLTQTSQRRCHRGPAAVCPCGLVPVTTWLTTGCRWPRAAVCPCGLLPVTTWLTTRCGFLGPAVQGCPPCLTQNSVTGCWPLGCL